MEWIHRDSVIKCDHDGRVVNQPSQQWVTISGVPVLVDSDPEGRSIAACPNYGPTIKPCAKTLKVAVGYSGPFTIGGKGVVLSNLDGFTDGTPPGLVHYKVRDPEQIFVRADS
ncbi:hypothetical protein [Hamadaea tsunoensis]|uniref:hypothetical protein n=1 Tax=Hamadaea tsunoensis TaxID=53368 RepID=UPI0003F77AC0|nr:hypothetical protein [Hamadaea tsunoensis]